MGNKGLRIITLMIVCRIGIRHEQGWQTDAGDAFFANFDDDLSPALDKYINFMDYLIESLEAAKNKYDTVVDKAEALRY